MASVSIQCQPVLTMRGMKAAWAEEIRDYLSAGGGVTFHGATVEEVFDDGGEPAFRAVCLETGAVCDAWAFPNDISSDEGAAIQRAMDYLSDLHLHESNSPHACLHAFHVMEHDR